MWCMGVGVDVELGVRGPMIGGAVCPITSFDKLLENVCVRGTISLTSFGEKCA